VRVRGFAVFDGVGKAGTPFRLHTLVLNLFKILESLADKRVTATKIHKSEFLKSVKMQTQLSFFIFLKLVIPIIL